MPIVQKEVIHVKEYRVPDDGIEYADVSDSYSQEMMANWNAKGFPEKKVPIERKRAGKYIWEIDTFKAVMLIFG